MARKNLLSGLLGPASSPEARLPSPEPPRPRRGAIGAVSQSIADLKARSIVEIDPSLIEAGGMQDRLESDAGEDADLVRSIAEYGQQVPVLVRPHPEKEGCFQIVYGRRRVLALRDLGRPVKALVRDLDDQELVLAQGQENTARRDLSFIEKANFARQMIATGYDRKIICDALSIDKTVISRMLSVTEKVPLEIIEFIGAAPGVGRDRWLVVAELIDGRGHEVRHLIDKIVATARSGGSDARFAALQAYLERPTPAAQRHPCSASRLLAASDGTRLGSARVTDNALVLRLDRTGTQGFEGWLLDHLPEIHRDWLEARRMTPKPNKGGTTHGN